MLAPCCGIVNGVTATNDPSVSCMMDDAAGAVIEGAATDMPYASSDGDMRASVMGAAMGWYSDGVCDRRGDGCVEAMGWYRAMEGTDTRRTDGC